MPSAELQRANALRYSATSVGQIPRTGCRGRPCRCGRGAGWTIAGDAVTFAVSAVCLMRLRLPTRVPAQAGTFLADLREGWAAFASRRWVWAVVGYFGMSNIVWSAWLVLGPVTRVSHARWRSGLGHGLGRGWGRRPDRQPARGPRQAEAASGVRSAERWPHPRCRWPAWPQRPSVPLLIGGRAARGRRDDARSLRLGINVAAPRPRRVALARQLL